MAKAVSPQKIADCRELYLKYGGARHERIVAEMRGREWTTFTDRNLYVRTRKGRIEPGWPERFGWDRELFTAETRRRREGTGIRGIKEMPKGAGGTANGSSISCIPSIPVNNSPSRLGGSAANNNCKPKHGTAYASRQASERTVLRPAALEVPDKLKYNRQKARRLRRENERRIAGNASAGNAGALACNAGSSGVTNVDIEAASGRRSGVHAGEGACAPVEDFHSWLKTLPSIWKWDYRHQVYLYEHLQRVTDKQCKRLMIFMPPRHGKSELVTVRYTAWRLKRDPSMNVIISCYGQDLANRFSRKIKRVLIDDFAVSEARRRQEEGGTGMEEMKEIQNGHKAGNNPKRSSIPSIPSISSIPVNNNPQPEGSPFPFAKSRPANRVSEWETTMGGGLRAVGVGSGVTGFGADLIVIDDPVKSREQSNSKRFRDKVWDWYNDDLYTRLEPEGAIILIQTRWHQDDLAGRLLEAQADGGDQWTVVNLPALCESDGEEVTGMKRMEGMNGKDIDMPDEKYLPNISSIPSIPVNKPPRSDDWRQRGEALWPERFGVAALEEVRRRQGEYSFASLYQQTPVPAEGGLFKREWFEHIVEHAPPGLKWNRGYDLAVSTSKTADYTASFRVAYDLEGNLYIDGGFRRRIGFPDQRRYIFDRIDIERDTVHGIERALHGEGIMQDLRREARLRGRRFIGVNAKGDKHQRALKWQTLAADGRIRLVRGPWNRDFVDEVCTFPQSAHDDQLDAVSIAVAMFEDRPGKLIVF